MAIDPPFPELDELMEAIGEAGRRLSEIDASEGAAGNISVYLGWPVDPRRRFPFQCQIDLPRAYPALAGGSFLVTGSGRRLRDIQRDPVVNVGFLVINDDADTGTLYTAPGCLFQRLTSELNSHLTVHADHVQNTGTNLHALIHAQPPYLTFLSQIPAYQDEHYLNCHVLRWQPELIVQLPEGIGCVPFLVPGSEALEEATLVSLQEHRVVLWAKHGVIARSDVSPKRASDRIEYAETGARYEYMNLVSGELAEGLTQEEMLQICEAFDVETTIFDRGCDG